MKPILASIFFLFCVTTVQAQKPSKLDSLKNVLFHLPAEGKTFAGDTLRVRVFCEMGERTDNIDDAVKYFENSIQIAEKNNLNSLQAKILNLYGRKMKYQKNIFKSGKIFYQALATSEKEKDQFQTALALEGIADIFYEQNKYDSAIYYYRKVFDFYENNNDSKVIDINRKIGSTTASEGKYQEAIKIYEKCLELNKIFKVESADASTYNNLGVLYETINDTDKALFYELKAIDFFDNYGNKYEKNKIPSYIEIAHLYYLRGEYSKALKYAEIALKLSQNFSKSLESHAHKVLYRIYKAQGRFKEATLNLENYKAISDSLNSLNNNQRLGSLKFEYDNQKIQTENKILSSENKLKNIQNRLMIASLIIFLGIGFLIFRNNRILKIKNQEIESQKDKILNLNQTLEQKVELRTSELKRANEELVYKNYEITEALFKGQTIERKRVASELHDNLGSTLSALKWRLQSLNKESLSSKEQNIYDGILNTMQDAYSEVRLISHNMIPAELELYGFSKAIQKLIDDINESDKIIFSLKTDIKTKIDKKIDLELYSICLELVTNILKHSQAKQAKIEFYSSDSSIILKVSDNGLGLSPEVISRGMGLKNIQNRINSLGGFIELSSIPNKLTTYHITIPLFP